jgi:hypothetical protein
VSIQKQCDILLQVVYRVVADTKLTQEISKIRKIVLLKCVAPTVTKHSEG